MSDGSHGSVTTIDPVSSSVTKIPLGSQAGGLALEDRTAWVGVRGPEVAHRGGTLTVVAPSGDLDSIDPAVAYDGLSWSILALGYDGLVGFRRVGGLDGGTLVPDLALSKPEPTEGGRTYTFQLREGIRYSNGDPVEAEDFRGAIERVFAIETAPHGGGLVTTRASSAPDRCTSRGSVRSVPRHRRRRCTGNGDLPPRRTRSQLHLRLGLLFASPVPAGTPDTSEATAPIPTTGPYSIEPDTEVRVSSCSSAIAISDRGPRGLMGSLIGSCGRFLSDLDRQVGRSSAVAPTSRGAQRPRPRAETSHAGQIHLAPNRGSST